MPDIASYGALFASALLSATLLPGSSEAVLIGLLAAGEGNAAALVAIATAGNVLGSLCNWVLGRFFAHFRDRAWFPVKAAAYERACQWYARFGVWSLLLAWMPIVGDPLTLAAGVLRTDLRWFLPLVAAGKFGRYATIAVIALWWSQ